MMNIFRIVADWSHVIAVAVLLGNILYRKSCLGISGRSQLLFAIVYISRYADMWLDFRFISLYNTLMKMYFIAAALIIVFLIFVVFRKSYHIEKDMYLTELLLFPCFVFGLKYTYDIRPMSYHVEVLWTFSIYLELVAFIPQLFMIFKNKQIEKTVLFYLIGMGLYRTMYVANWAYRYFTEGYYDPTASTAGIVYIFLYIAVVIAFSCAGVMITEGGNKTNLRRNIFFISSNDPLIHTSSQFMDPISAEKNEYAIHGIRNV